MLRKRIGYVPGAISLLALCPLMMFQLHRWNAFEKHYVLEVMWPNPDGGLHDKYYQQPVAATNYRTITFTGHRDADSLKIAYAKNSIHAITTQTVTPRLIRFHFTGSAKYESFVQIIDLCDKEQVLYVLYPNDCWVFNRKAREDAWIH